jgi:hypothetical protein
MDIMQKLANEELALLAQKARIDEQLVAVRNAMQGIRMAVEMAKQEQSETAPAADSEAPKAD